MRWHTSAHRSRSAPRFGASSCIPRGPSTAGIRIDSRSERAFMIRSSRPIPLKAVANHYDELDRIYREVWGEHVHHGLWRTGRESPSEAVEALTALVAEQAGIRPGDRVCDIGSGYG